MSELVPNTVDQPSAPLPHVLRARRLGMESAARDRTVFMRSDCFICRAEGLTARSQILVAAGGREILASLIHSSGTLLASDEIGFSEAAWLALGLAPGDPVSVRHAPPIASMADLRSRIYGHRLSESGFRSIINDIVAGHYTDVHLSAFVTACSAVPLDHREIVGLTRAMVDSGERLSWAADVIVDKHSVGGLPGNRTTPIVVAILAALGLVMPKTSSRAITSPAGTADTMETLAPVDLDLTAIRQVVDKEGGCIVWGGSVRLSPADDIIIGVERVLDLDAVGQLVASVLSKKIAAGATHLLIDMPVGPTAKVRTAEAATLLTAALLAGAEAFGLRTRVMRGSGDEPIGRGIGPALEARDILAVLQGRDGPQDLAHRACELAGALLELVGQYPPNEGYAAAATTLRDGRAWRKFQGICEAQGGMRTPPLSSYRHVLTAVRAGPVASLDNRKIAKIAKLAGAPAAKAAGVEMHVRLGDQVDVDAPLCTIHAESRGELDYALSFAVSDGAVFTLGPQ